jgi:hypothetical protein
MAVPPICLLGSRRLVCLFYLPFVSPCVYFAVLFYLSFVLPCVYFTYPSLYNLDSHDWCSPWLCVFCVCVCGWSSLHHAVKVHSLPWRAGIGGIIYPLVVRLHIRYCCLWLVKHIHVKSTNIKQYNFLACSCFCVMCWSCFIAIIAAVFLLVFLWFMMSVCRDDKFRVIYASL